MTNCPNCGAPIVANKCEYCGTVFTSSPVPSAKVGYCTETITYLRLKNQLLQRQIELDHLYTEALNAMKKYGYHFG